MLVYCDYIADRIKNGLRDDSYKEETLISYVDKINWDLTPEGYFNSTKKTIKVQDKSGRWYKITVEEDAA